ncbi:MAG TPA: hypothetical protein VE082_02895, partial [Desulfobaccales bacterium]|nr:hypothetical protein [Desulfobaccales bacterium]
IVVAVLVIFAVGNSQPTPEIKFLKYQLGVLPTFLLAYISLAVGLIVGWVSHSLRIRRKRQEAQALQAASAQKQENSE